MQEHYKVGNNLKIWHPEKSVILCEWFGDDVTIHAPVWIGKDVFIGNRVKIQAFAFIPDGVTLEDDVFIGPHVCFTNDPNLEVKGREFWKPTLVKKGAKIGANTVLRAGVTVGENAVIGCGSTILKDVPAGETWVGNPAYSLKEKKMDDAKYELIQQSTLEKLDEDIKQEEMNCPNPETCEKLKGLRQYRKLYGSVHL